MASSKKKPVKAEKVTIRVGKFRAPIVGDDYAKLMELSEVEQRSPSNVVRRLIRSAHTKLG